MIVNPRHLTVGEFKLRAIGATNKFVAAVLFFFIKAEVALGKKCDSAFTTVSFTQPVSASTQPPSMDQPLLDVQARQFIQLLITTQSKGLSSSQRQTRLADVQRTFSELTKAHPEMAELIQAEWRKLHSGTESATESRRTKLISEIQVLQQQLLELTDQSWQVGVWEIIKDSNSSPTVRAELATYFANPSDSHYPEKLLKVRARRYIVVDSTNGLGEFDTQIPGGHSGTVNGARLLPDGRILSWSDDQTLILWKLSDGTYVIDHKIGESGNTDPKKGHTLWVNGSQILPDGRILSWSGDHTLILWKLVNDTYVIEQRLGVDQNSVPEKGHTYWVTGAQLLPDGKILSWSGDHTLILWMLVNNTYFIEQRLGDEAENQDPTKGHIGLVKGAQILPDGRLLSWSLDRTLILWKFTSGQYDIEHKLGKARNSDPNNGHTAQIREARWLPDGCIVSCDDSDRYLLSRYALRQGSAPSAIQTEIESLSKELDSLKTALTGLEAQRSSSEDISEAGAP